MLIRVFKIPEPTPGYCFDGGKPATFTEVDWFRDDPTGLRKSPLSEAEITEFIKRKSYFDPNAAFLVLSPYHTFTINYKAP